MLKKIYLLLMIMVVGCHQITLIKTGENEMLKRIGEEFELVVSFEDATDVIGVNAWIDYDPAIIEVVDNDPGAPGTQVIATDLGYFSGADLVVGLQKDIDNNEVPGSLICGYVSDPLVAVSGTGNCFGVTFRAIATGNTDVVFSQLNLQDMDGDIPANAAVDSVEVPLTATVRITVQ